MKSASITLNITEVTVFRPRHGMDHVTLYTDIPEITHYNHGKLELEFKLPRGIVDVFLDRRFGITEYTLFEQPKANFNFKRTEE